MHFLYLTLIILSTAGITFVLAAKLREVRTGEDGVLARVSGAGDMFFRRQIDVGAALLSHCNASNAEKVWRRGAEHLFHLCGTAGLFLSRQYGHLKSKFNGKRLPKTGGVVSFFLKNVSESKEDRKDI